MSAALPKTRTETTAMMGRAVYTRVYGAMGLAKLSKIARSLGTRYFPSNTIADGRHVSRETLLRKSDSFPSRERKDRRDAFYREVNLTIGIPRTD